MEIKESKDVESRSRLRIQKKKSSEMVKEAEIEDFFQTAEKDLRSKMLECSMKSVFFFNFNSNFIRFKIK